MSALYHRIRERHDYNHPSLAMRVMGKPLVEAYGKSGDPLIVSHPTLVGMLSDREHLIYQHGELVAPRESLVRGASLVCVPTHEVADQFMSAGYSRGRILVTGLCVEPALVRIAGDAFDSRMRRLQVSGGLCGGFFSSGAEPTAHVESIALAAVSAVRQGGSVVILARQGGKLAHRVQAAFRRAGITAVSIDTETVIPAEYSPATLVTFRNRREENSLTACFFSRLDYFVAPSHERVNWAVGLGLPMFALTPPIGPFAPLNLDLVVAAEAAQPLGDKREADQFGDLLARLQRTGRLATMAEHSWQKQDINGFLRIADYLISHYTT
jgi:hypothetical protein